MRQVWRLGSGAVLMACLLSACMSQPRAFVRPIGSGATAPVTADASAPEPKATVVRETLTGSVSVPRIDCSTVLSKEDDLSRSLIEERMREGSNYAALAQIQTLPAKVASVAILRADILRRLNAPEAEAWYLAMRGTCVGGQAEHGLGLMAASRQDYVLARKHLMAAVEQQPAKSALRNDLGYIYLFLGQDPQAEFELRTASELAPEERQPALNLALLALLRGDTAGWWRWRERLKPTDSERMALERSCRELVQRRAERSGKTAGTAAACPLNPGL